MFSFPRTFYACYFCFEKRKDEHNIFLTCGHRKAVLFVVIYSLDFTLFPENDACLHIGQYGFCFRYLASWALLIQFLMCLILPIFTGKKSSVVVDSDNFAFFFNLLIYNVIMPCTMYNLLTFSLAEACIREGTILTLSMARRRPIRSQLRIRWARGL